MASNGYANGPSHGQEINGIGRGRYVENGREYQLWHKGQYMFPMDENELDRLDAMHKFFLVARRYHLWSPHVIFEQHSIKVLDLGCGTGIWALDVAKKLWQSNPNSIVKGVDLSTDMQTPMIYANTSFSAMDIEEPWLPEVGESSWHFIHIRMLYGSVFSWPHVYSQIFKHLIPGTGWMEHVEIDWSPENETGPVSPRLKFWIDELLDAMERAGRPMRVDPHHTRQMLSNVGFTEIKEELIRVPVNGGSTNPFEIDIGRWFNLCLHKGFMALSLAPLCRHKHWTPDQISALQSEVLQEIGDRNNRTFLKLYIWTAKRPQHNLQ